MAGKVNLEISKKASFEYVCYIIDVLNETYKNDPLSTAHTPVDLTGCTGSAKVKDKVGGTILATFTVTFPNPTKGQVKLTLDASVTAALNAANFKPAVWDMFITFPAGNVEKYVEGNVTLDVNVT